MQTNDAVPAPTSVSPTVRTLGRTLAISLLNVLALALFLGIGVWSGPRLRDAYARLFPEPAYVTGDYAAIYRQAGKPVVMFSKTTCPYCRHARELLQRDHVEFVEYVIDESPEARRQFDQLGGSGVPLLFIGDRRIVGFREDTLRASLALLANR